MWLVELAFDDSPERLEARPAHREKLDGLKAKGLVRMAGPLADDSGAVLVFDTDDCAELDGPLADDPYFSITGVVVERVREWRPFLA
jgi:uncharacterized protein YciI